MNLQTTFLWQQIPSTIISEIYCNSKIFDGVVLDTEHGIFNNETLFNCIQIIKSNKKKCFVRLTEINKTLIRYVLDAGCDGLIFSTIEEAKQIDEIFNVCFYPKHKGKRGQGLVRENMWGIQEKNLNEKKPIIIPQIETMTGVNNLRILISKKEVDYFLIGPYDLSASLGYPGDFENSEFKKAINTIEGALGKNRIGIHLPKNIEDNLEKYKDYGFLALGMDTTSLVSKMQSLENEIKNRIH